MQFSKITMFLMSVVVLSASALAQEKPDNKKSVETLMQEQERLMKTKKFDMDSIVSQAKQLQQAQEKTNSNSPKDFLEANQKAMDNWKKNQEGKALIDNSNVNAGKSSQLANDFMAQHQKRVNAATANFKAQGMLDGFDKKSIEEKTKQFRAAAIESAKATDVQLAKTLKNEFGVDFNGTPDFNPQEPTDLEQFKAIFITFEMADSEIATVLEQASQQGASVFLKGMHKDDTGIHDTIKRLRFIGRDIETPPDVKFKPRYFDEYNIKVAPSIVARNGDRVVIASGITNTQWLERKLKTDEGFLGFYGDTKPVTEEDIRVTFKKRMAGYNFEGKRDQIVKGFWTKQSFNNLPRASKDETWFIDVRGTASKDVTNPNGDTLATKGQKLDPISMMTMPLTLYIFDPKDTKQLEWITRTYGTEEYGGKRMIIFSRLDKQKGWEHLSALRKHFGQEIYKLPKEMVRTFDISSLPVRVSTDIDKGLMKVEQFNINGEVK